MLVADASKLPNLGDLSGSLTDRVHGAVRSAILTLDFPPGSVIRKNDVCDHLGVSRSPVSDAFSKLSSEGLVDVVPQSGTRVSRLSMAAIREDAFLREALEVAAARHAALHRSEDVVAKIARNIEIQKLLIADEDGEEFMKTDIEFHQLIMGTTGLARLPKAVRNLSQNVNRARVLLIPEPGRLNDTLTDHVAIFEAIRDQDCNTSVEAMRHHIRQLLKRLEPLEAERPELFST